MNLFLLLFTCQTTSRHEAHIRFTPLPTAHVMAVTLSSVPVDACYAVACGTCGKTTWKGCGQHVDSVMKDVKDEDKCKCPRA
ncbi:unnamed protein product [Peniophora sp. CBMAI 1063]|nr:unnamed protein product [Peniophora sp. CBMAI 1063]